ncbi:copper resistance CopC family protein [Kitasatospora sp. NPDC088391]|uniref:copper resistance CopC family protein n=1 Tax=Kitasatospora sp. NPDC088391 TaxID=3364074 RepID=UPI00380FDE80
MSATGSPQSFRRTLALGVGTVLVLLLGLLWISARQPVRLAGATPGDGSSLAADRPPTEVELTFSGDDFTPGSVYLQVNGPDGASVTEGRPRVDGHRLVAPVRVRDRGTYRITYRVVLNGGREVSGTTAFGLGTPAAPAAAPADEPAPAHDHGVEGAWNLLLLGVDAVVIPGALYLLLRRPRLRRPRTS